jgi:hypothetical protein
MIPREFESQLPQAQERWHQTPVEVRRHVTGITRLLQEPWVFPRGVRPLDADAPMSLADLAISPLKLVGSMRCPFYLVHPVAPIAVREAQMTLKRQPTSGLELKIESAALGDGRFAVLNGSLTTTRKAPFIQGLQVVDLGKHTPYPILTVVWDTQIGRYVPLHAKHARVTPDFGGIFLGVAGHTTGLMQPWGGFLVAREVTRLKRRR